MSPLIMTRTSSDTIVGDPKHHVFWFRSLKFDATLTLGVLVFSLMLGGLGLISERWFYWVLWFDVWLIAHPHLAAMYTRLVFDRESARRSRLLITVLPVVVLLGTAGVGIWGGALWLITGYYFWQTWHYTRQSYGIGRALTRGQFNHQRIDGWLTSGVVFAFPIWGLLHRVHQASPEFYGWPIFFPTINSALVTIAAVIATSLLVVWCGYRVVTFQTYNVFHRPLITHSIFILSHVAITVVSYLLVTEITQGWLFINIWHNAQYLVFVWAYNARRTQVSQSNTDHLGLLRTLSQPTCKSIASYLSLCIILGTLFFLGVDMIISAFEWISLTSMISSQANLGITPGHFSLLLVIHLSINFHHYLVDAIIWKRKRERTPDLDITLA